MKPWCVGHHCVVIQSLHHHPTMCVHHGVGWIEVCDRACMTNGVCVVVEGDWWHLWLVAWLCHPHVCLFAIHHKWHSPHMPIFCCTTPKWMARGPGDLPSCIGWLFCDHSFSLSNHNCLLFFLKPSFLLTSTSSWMLRDDLCDGVNGSCKCLILFFPVPVFDCLSASNL